MSVGIGICLVAGIAAIIGGVRGGKFAAFSIGVAWLGLVVGVGMAAFMEVFPQELAAYAVMAMIAVQPPQSHGISRGLLASGMTVVLVGMIAGLLGESALIGGGAVGIVVGIWAALSGAMGFFAHAVFDDSDDEAIGAGMVVAAALLSLFAIASGRAAVGEWGYRVFLATDAGPLFWTLPGVEKLPDGIRLAVVASTPSWWIWGLGLGALLALFGSVLPFTPLLKWTRILRGVVVVISVAIMVSLLTMEVPREIELGPYLDYGVQALMRAQAPEGAAALGALSDSGEPFISKSSMILDLLLLGLAGIWSFVATLGAGRGADWKPTAAPFESVSKGAALLWLTWFMSGFFHIGVLGTPGMRSASEWMGVGLVLFVTGACLVAYSQREHVRRGPAMVAGVSMASTVVVAALAATFGALPWVSLGLY